MQGGLGLGQQQMMVGGGIGLEGNMGGALNRSMNMQQNFGL